jgi:hypothetical protein
VCNLAIRVCIALTVACGSAPAPRTHTARAEAPILVGIVSGHGSPALASFSTLQTLLPGYRLREVDTNAAIDGGLRALLIIGPTRAFSEAELRRIDRYVMQGGSLGVFGGTTNVDMTGTPPTATPVDTGVNRLLQRWGITIDDSIVADAHCQDIPLSRQYPIPVPYPPAPVVAFDDASHRVLRGVGEATFFFASPISTANEFRELHGEILARSSSESSWLLEGDTIDLNPRVPEEWRSTIGEIAPHVLLVALSGRLPSAFEGGEAQRDARVLVAGTWGILRDDLLPAPEQGDQSRRTGAHALAMNIVRWLARDTD